MAETENDRRDSIWDEAATAAGGGQPEPAMEIKQASRQRVQAGQVHMQESSARVVEASAVRMEKSAVARVRANVVDAKESALGVTVAHEARLTDLTSPLLIANKVEAANTRTLFLLAWQVNGQVKTLVGPRMLTGLLAALAALWVGRKWVRGRAGTQAVTPRRS
jgi:hypothetical protein